MAQKPTTAEMDFKEIQELVKMVTKSDIMELEIERKDFRVRISKGNSKSSMVYEMPPTLQYASAPQVQGNNAQGGEMQPAAPKEDVTLYTFKSPMIGTFYRSTSPEKEFFVKVGDSVSAGSVLCIVEAMKLFNEIECDVSGKIVKILVENAQPVEFDQPLFLIQKD